MISDVLANAHQCICKDLRIDNLVGEHGFGMHVGRILPLLYIYRPIFQRNRYDFAELLAAHSAQVFVAAQIGILGRKAVAMDWRPCGAPGRSDEGESGESGSLVKQFIGGKRGQPEVLPPYRFVLSPVPIEDVREEPPCVLLP